MRLGLLVENDAPFVFDEVHALRALGASVSVASVFRPAPRWSGAFGGPVLYPSRGLAAWARTAWPAAAAPSRAAGLLRAARREGAPLRLTALAAGLARRARREGWHHVHGSFATYPAWTAWAVAELAGIPFSFTGHAYDVQAPRPWLGRLAAEAAFVRAISEDAAQRIRRAVPAGAAERVRVGRLGVDLERFRPGPALRREPPEIVCVAQLGPTKGLAVLIDAVGRLVRAGRAVALTVLGEGPLRATLEAQVQALGLRRVVRLAGTASREEVRRTLARATLFALPCVVVGAGRHDGLPVALLEAMATGLAVVTTPVGGIPEVVRDGVTGRLVTPGDAEALARALAELLDDPAGRVRLGTAARMQMAADFSRERAAARLLAWLRAAAPAAPGARHPALPASDALGAAP